MLTSNHMTSLMTTAFIYIAVQPAAYALSTCPYGMVSRGVPNSESAFCIEEDERPAATYVTAVRTCAEAGRHLCTLDQWMIGAAAADGTPHMDVPDMCEPPESGYEWTTAKFIGGDFPDNVGLGSDSLCSGGSLIGLGNFGINADSQSYEYRCCRGGKW